MSANGPIAVVDAACNEVSERPSSRREQKRLHLRIDSDEAFAPSIFVNLHFADLEKVGVVAKVVKLELAQSCLLRFGSSAVDPDEFNRLLAELSQGTFSGGRLT